VKKLIVFIFLIPIIGFSQNKKELIATVNRLKTDSTKLKETVDKKVDDINNLLESIDKLKSSKINLENNLKATNQDLLSLKNEHNISINENVNLQNKVAELTTLSNLQNDSLMLLKKEINNLKNNLFEVDMGIKYVSKSSKNEYPVSEDCDSIFFVDFKIHNKVVFSEEVCGNKWNYDESLQFGCLLFQGEEDGVTLLTRYYFIKLSDNLIIVYKELETSLEVPFIFWVKYYSYYNEENDDFSWKLLKTIKKENEINNIISVIKDI
jgi:hypothetical protein